MSRNQLFNLTIAAALVIVISFTVREAAATSDVTSQAAGVLRCNSLPSPYSLHSKVNESGTRWLYTEDGPTGVDGGLIELLSSYRTCSR
jgi:hypothetical protein